jgi:uncharacterized membrane protein
MTEAPVELFVAAFPGEQDADEALKQVKAARKEGLIGIVNVAVLRRDAKDKLHVRELRDMRGGKGAAIGGAIGAAVGLLFPPSVILAGSVGAAVGGLAAKLRDSGFPDGELRELGAGLQPGTSAIVAVIEHRWVADLEHALEAEGARIVRQGLADDIRAQLEAGRSVVYSVLAGEGGAALSRVSAGEDHLEIEHMLVDDEGVAAVALVADAVPASAADEATPANAESPADAKPEA